MDLINNNLLFLKENGCHFVDELTIFIKENDLQCLTDAFYGFQSPQVACNEQANVFLNHPQHLSLHFSSVPNSDWRHERLIFKMNEVAEELGWRPNSKPQKGTLLLLGSGAGYHIPYLLKQIQYSDVILLESDFRQLSMLCQSVDLSEIQQICSQRGGSFTLLQCSDYAEFNVQMRAILIARGTHLIADISIFRHYESAFFDLIFEQFKEWRNSLASLWGFFEDELMGLEHSTSNLMSMNFERNSCQVEQLKNIPIILVGNGPSLDKALQTLHDIQDRVVIVSCGTSLNPLVSRGIIPDIHVEMERSSLNFSMKQQVLSNVHLNDTLLIGLNTICPSFTARFKHHILFPKAHDVGVAFLEKQGVKINALYHCNPTVTNMGASSLIRLGASEIILVGCDYGYIDPKHHHSLASDYYNDDSFLNEVSYRKELTIKGNFREHVSTERIYNEARLSLEHLLKQNPSISVINTSDGALIQGTRSEELSQLEFVGYEKAKVIAELHDMSVGAKSTLQKMIFMDMKGSESVLQELLEQVKSKDFEHIQRALSKALSQLVNDKNLNPERILLSGTFKYITTMVSSHINHIPPKNRSQYSASLSVYLDKCLNNMLSRLKQLTT